MSAGSRCRLNTSPIATRCFPPARNHKKTIVLLEWVVDVFRVPILGAGSVVGDYSGASFHRVRRDTSRTLGVHRYRSAGSTNRGRTDVHYLCCVYLFETQALRSQYLRHNETL